MSERKVIIKDLTISYEDLIFAKKEELTLIIKLRSKDNADYFCYENEDELNKDFDKLYNLFPAEGATIMDINKNKDKDKKSRAILNEIDRDDPDRTVNDKGLDKKGYDYDEGLDEKRKKEKLKK